MSIRKIKESMLSGGPRHSVLYARVSSKEQEQGYSILAQQELLRGYGTEQDFVIDQEFVDVETAKKAGRPGFSAMMKYLQKNPDCCVILVEKTDRLYRNWSDAAWVEELGVELHLVKENQIISTTSRAADKYRHRMNVVDGKRYVENLSEEVQKGLRTKAGQGLWPSYAPMGYRNTDGPDGKRIIVPDPILGPVVRNLFEWFATGEYSLQRLACKAYEEGFRFRKSGRKVPVSSLGTMLRRRLYMGEFDYGGSRYEGTHEPLVSRAVWDRVQEILNRRAQKKHRKVTHEFAFSGMVSCGHCHCSLVGEVKKGRYVYYHCTGYRGKCGEPYTREETLEQEFAKGLRELSLPPAVLDWLQAQLVESEKVARALQEKALRRDQEDLERLQRRQELLYEDRLDGRIDAATYDTKIAQLGVQQQQVQQRIRADQAEMPWPMGQALDLEKSTCRVAEEFLEQPAREQRRLLNVVLQQASWKGGELRISLQEPFEALRLANQRATNSHPEGVGEEAPTRTLFQAVEIQRPDSPGAGDSISRRDAPSEAT